jgi:hypothetical protein
MKLHGSLNWKYCEKCAELSPWELGEYFRNRHFFEPPRDVIRLDVA